VIVATGGLSYERTGSTGDGLRFARDLGLQVTECQPSLVPFEIEEDFCRNLMGLSLRNVTLSCYTKKKNKDKLLYQEQGEMLFTHFGISGPLVLSASAYTGKAKGEPIWVEIDLKPALTIEQLDARILRDFDAAKNKQVRNALDELLPKKLIPVMIELAEIDPFKQVNAVTKEERERLIACMKKLTLHVVGTRGYEEAIITRGGVSVKEINPKTMEAKQIPGLYFIGEVLDVDALTGGFNLQIAWATAATVLLSE
jgi:predicted Rossmann fold flavoprotein